MMPTMTQPVGSSLSFSAARAQQAYAPVRTNRASAIKPTAPTEPIARIGAPHAEPTPKKPAPKAEPTRLVAATVRSIDLTSDVATVSGAGSGAASVRHSGSAGVYSIYRHPADRNAAATGVASGQALGRSLDIEG